MPVFGLFVSFTLFAEFGREHLKPILPVANVQKRLPILQGRVDVTDLFSKLSPEQAELKSAMFEAKLPLKDAKYLFQFIPLIFGLI